MLSNRYKIVTLLLTRPHAIPLWISDGKFTKEEVGQAIDYLRENASDSNGEVENAIAQLLENAKFYDALNKAYTSSNDVEERIENVWKIMRKKINGEPL